MSKVIYNVTIKVNHIIAADWRQWMLQEHIPMLMKTGCFMDAAFYRLLEQDDTDGPTFCAQYFCAQKSDYERYLNDFAANMRAETQKLWGNNLVAFRSIMEEQSL
jgi:hypothetical protein